MVMVMMFVMAYERYSHQGKRTFPRWESIIPTVGTHHSRRGNDFEGAAFVGLQLLIYYCFMIPIPTIFTSLKGC